MSEGAQKKMEPVIPLFTTESAKLSLYKEFEKNESQVKEDVTDIEAWLRQQMHLPQQLPYDDFIEHLLIYNKFNVQKTKDKIERYFTLKTQHLDIYEAMETDAHFLTIEQNQVGFYFLPNPGPEGELILVVQTSPSDLYNFEQYVALSIATAELLLRYYHSGKMRIIFDNANVTMEIFKKTDIAKFVRTMSLFVSAYSFRIVSVDIFNSPPFVNLILNPLRLVLSQKIVGRMKVHSTKDAMYESIPARYLPKDFGGEQTSLDQLLERTLSMFGRHLDFFKEMVQFRSNECGLKPEEMAGTFKKLDFD